MARRTSVLLASILSIVLVELQRVAAIRASYETFPMNEETARNPILPYHDKASTRSALARVEAESRRVNPLRLLMSKPRVSPLYLINGTVCRFVNLQPVCTTLSTTGLSVGAGGAPRPAAGGSGGGSSSGGAGAGGAGARPPSGGASGGGGGGSGGASGSSGGARPGTSGVQSAGSSVQFANNPPRTQNVLQDERPDVFVERLDNSAELMETQQTATRPVGVVMNRPRLGLFRRPTRYQFVTNRQEDILKESLVKNPLRGSKFSEKLA